MLTNHKADHATRRTRYYAAIGATLLLATLAQFTVIALTSTLG